MEIIPDDRPPTNKQEQLIAKLVEDFPDAKELMEYEDYGSPNKSNGVRAHHAGAGIELGQALVDGWLRQVHRPAAESGAVG